ncbi:fam-l protein [Plasmodium malariae]|uniref:Fam-l protein n=1 Tax=Plasmodium malariae TaxID=5858 RepID=A0A1D3JKK7_PLAMA|nr:fam-l protein [Plasmodium malariae]SBT87042.1 fam-l protein [Plasmodium malariae]
MGRRTKLLFFIKIFTFIFLTCIYQFYNDVRTFNKLSYGNHKHGIEVHIRIYRLLVKNKFHKDSRVMGLKEKASNIKENENKDTCNNEKGTSAKKEYLCGNLSKNNGCHKQPMKSKSFIFETKKCSYMEKKIFKELDYMEYLKNNRTIRDKTYNKIIRKKYGFRIALPLLLFSLVSLLPILDLLLGVTIEDLLLVKTGLFSVSSEGSKTLTAKVSILSFLTNSVLKYVWCIIIYCLPFIILGVIFILMIVYHHKKFKKFEKIKFKKR